MGERDDAIILFLFEARYATSFQIGEVFFQTVSKEFRARAVWRRLNQLAADNFVRVIEQPVYRRDRNGTKPLIYTLAGRGAERAAALAAVPLRQIDVRPKARERNISYLEHDLGIVDYWLALRRACVESGISLDSWVKDHLLQKEPDRVEIVNDDGSLDTYGLVADAYCVLGMGDRAAQYFLEYDRATVTVKASDWTRKSWYRKIRGYLALSDSDRLKERYDADALWVMVVVEGGEQRLQHLLSAAEKVAGERAHHFWFTTTARLGSHNMLCDEVWSVGGMADALHSIFEKKHDSSVGE